MASLCIGTRKAFRRSTVAFRDDLTGASAGSGSPRRRPSTRRFECALHVSLASLLPDYAGAVARPRSIQATRQKM